VDDLKSAGILPEVNAGFESRHMGYAGLGYHGSDLPEFEVFVNIYANRN